MAFEGPDFNKKEGAGFESIPLTKEQVQKTLEETPDATERREFVTRELEKVRTQRKNGIPVEEGLEEYLIGEEATERELLLP